MPVMAAPAIEPMTVEMSDRPPGVVRRKVRDVTHPTTTPKHQAPRSMIILSDPCTDPRRSLQERQCRSTFRTSRRAASIDSSSFEGGSIG